MASGTVNLVAQLKDAQKTHRPVNFVYRAKVDGKVRARFGTVVDVTDTHVTIYDILVAGTRSCVLDNIVDGIRFN